MCIQSQSSRGYRTFSLRTFNMLVRSTGQKLKSEIISKGFQNFAKIWTMSSGHTLRQILPTSVKDLLTKRKKVPKSWRSHQDTNMIFLKVCPESNGLCWKFPKDRLCYFLFEHYEGSAKLHLLRMSVCLFLCMMGIWKVLLHQWWLWGPAAAIRWRNHRRFVAADHWRRAEGGRGGLIMPKQGLIPTICLLSTVYTFTLRLLTVYSKVHCTVHSSKGGGVNLSLQRSVMSEFTRNPEEELQHRATNVSWS